MPTGVHTVSTKYTPGKSKGFVLLQIELHLMNVHINSSTTHSTNTRARPSSLVKLLYSTRRHHRVCTWSASGGYTKSEKHSVTNMYEQLAEPVEELPHCLFTDSSELADLKEGRSGAQNAEHTKDLRHTSHPKLSQQTDLQFEERTGPASHICPRVREPTLGAHVQPAPRTMDRAHGNLGGSLSQHGSLGSPRQGGP